MENSRSTSRMVTIRCPLSFRQFLIANIFLITGYNRPYFGLDNGCHSSVVRFLSASDGKQQIIKTALKIATDKSRTSPVSLSVSELDDLIREDLDFPDPEVVIRIGRTPCLFGFLPWQMRLTEIFMMPELENFDDENGMRCFDDLLEVLGTYGRCEQRFGK